MLYEGELLYSWFARYHVHTANMSFKQTMNDLFGKMSTVSVPDLPTNLNEFSKRLAGFQIPDVEYLIKNHTFYRFYTTFTPADTKGRVLEAMRDDEYQSLHLFLGIASSTVKNNSYFMYCPKCQLEDMNNKGEIYWKLEHQLPGVVLCLEHKTILLRSSVKFRPDKRHEFVAAEFNNCKSVEVKAEFREELISHAFQLADQIRKMVTSDYHFTLEGIQSAYKFLLKREGFISVNGRVNQQLLSERFLKHYGKEFLRIMQSPINRGSETCWLKSITRKHRKLFHPIRHLLLINFLGESLDTFYSYTEHEIRPFGEGPYYCLNPAADHYKQRVVMDVSITRCTSTRKLVGTFKCECGFIYSRREADTENTNLFRVGRIKQFGPVWKNKLKFLFYNEKRTYTEISQILNCDRGTVKKYLNNFQKDVIKEKDSIHSNLRKKRDEWLGLLESNQGETVTAVRKLQPNLYIWLYRNDKEWLKNHSPIQNKRNDIGHSRVDWNLRDEELLEEIFLIIPVLYQVEKPVHINITKIGKEIGKLSLFEKHLDKLPRTREYLIRNIESIEQFQIRRVQWAAEVLMNQQGFVTEWEIKRLAGLKESISTEVREALKCKVNTYNLTRKEEFGFGEN